jgi:peroxiredoxin
MTVRVPFPTLLCCFAVAFAFCVACAKVAPRDPVAGRPSATARAPVPAVPPPLPESPSSETAGPGWLGVELGTVDGGAGVLVRSTLRDSPAEKAGLAGGDVLLSIDGQPVNEPAAVVDIIAGRGAGTRAALVFLRDRQQRLAAVQLATKPRDDELMQKAFVGMPAPSLATVQTVQGRVEPNLRGKVVVLEFWATWCFVCRMMVPTLNEWHERYAAQGVQVIGVTSEGVQYAAQAASSLGMGYAIASDASGRATLAYKALALPTLFVIDRQGTIREVVVGYSEERLTHVETLIEQLLREG